MRTWIGLALLTLVGCDDRPVEAVPLVPGGTGRSCTKMGCSDGVQFEATVALPWAARSRLRATVCRNETCAVAAPLESSGAKLTLWVAAPLDGLLSAVEVDEGASTRLTGFVNTTTRDAVDGERWTLHVRADGLPGDVATSTVSATYQPYWPNGRACDEPHGYTCHRANLGVVLGCGAPDACAAGTSEETACGSSHKKTRVCDRACRWSEWSVCGAWRPMAAPPDSFVTKNPPTAAWVGERLVFASDGAGSTPIRAAAYDPKADAWTALPDGPTAWLAASSAGTPDGTFFVWSSDGLLSLTSAGWSNVPTPGFSPASKVTVVSAYLPATGEVLFWACPWSPLTGTSPDAIAFHPGKGTWRSVAPRPIDRSTCAAHEIGGRLALSHGDAARTVSLYDATLDVWTSTTVPFSGLLTRDALTVFAGGGFAPLSVAVFEGPSWTALPSPSPAALPLHAYEGGAFVGTVGARPFLWTGTAGAVFSAKAWAPLPAGGPSPRWMPLVLAHGGETIVWGGSGETRLRDGARLTVE